MMALQMQERQNAANSDRLPMELVVVDYML
jgi:hypothetical protein